MILDHTNTQVHWLLEPQPPLRSLTESVARLMYLREYDNRDNSYKTSPKTLFHTYTQHPPHHTHVPHDHTLRFFGFFRFWPDQWCHTGPHVHRTCGCAVRSSHDRTCDEKKLKIFFCPFSSRFDPFHRASFPRTKTIFFSAKKKISMWLDLWQK